MKKKIINGLLFAVALVAATSSFVSCKDYDADNYNELQAKYLSLQDALNKQLSAMNDYVLTSKYNQEVGANYDVNKGTIKQRLDDIEKELDPTNPNSLAEQVHKNNEAILSLGDTLKHFVFMWGDNLTDAYANAGKAKQIALSYDTDTAKINKAIKDAKAVADSAWNYVNKGLAVDKDGKTKEDFQAWVKYFEAADAALAEDIAALKQDVNNILKLVQQQVTGIEIQATKNPLFGSFAYPIEVQSNILALYYGKAENPVRFPAGDKGAEASTWALAPAVLTSELDAIGAPRIMLKAGEVAMLKEEGNAGVIYLTVNPSDVDMTGKEFTLRASDNSVSKVALSQLEPCTEQLKWGYNRAASANGFYTAKATINESDVDAVALSFDVKSIASDIKEIMQDWSKSSASDIAKLAMAIRDGFKADVPRLGVQAQWKDTLGWKNYVSKYDVAAFSAKALGYEFLKDADFSPAIVKFHNKIIAKEKAFEMELLQEIANMITINLGLPTTGGNIFVDEATGKIYLRIPANSVTMSGTGTVAVAAGQLGTIDLTAYGAGTYQIPTTSQNLNASVNATNPQNIDMDITPLYEAIAGSITTAMNNIKDNASNTIDKYMKKIINAENKIFGKVESVAKNLNRFVQPALVAKSSDFGFFYPSRLYSAPTEVRKGSKILLYPTSLTGEVVVPAFKKYVAITGAWETTGTYGNITKMLEAKDYNTGVLNTILEGNAYNLDNAIEFTVPEVKTGTVLEFTYECLGYNGLVAGKKFYVAVYE